MRDKSHLISLFALFLVMLISGLLGLACGGSSNQGNKNTTLDTPSPSPSPTPDPCAAVTDDMIKYAIYGQITKDTSIPIQQVNVSVDKGVVTLIGFVMNSTQKAKVIGMAEATSCVKKPVNTEQFYDCAPGKPVQPDSVGGCGSGWARCGDICVPDHCFWNEAPAPGTTPSPVIPKSSATPCPPTATPTPTPGTNTNTNTNKLNSNSNSNY